MAECTDKYTQFTIEPRKYLESIKGDKVKQAAIMVETNKSGVTQSGEVVVVQMNDVGEIKVEGSAEEQNTRKQATLDETQEAQGANVLW